MNRRTLILAIILIFCVVCPSFAGSDNKSLDEIKNQTYLDLDGKKRNVGEFKGKVLLVNFWASWCAPCYMEIPTLNKIHQQHSPRGLIILSLSLDSQFGLTRIKDIAKQKRMKYTVGKADEKMVNEMKIFAIPMSFLFGKDGKMIRQYMGPPNEDQLRKDIKEALAK